MKEASGSRTGEEEKEDSCCCCCYCCRHCTGYSQQRKTRGKRHSEGSDQQNWLMSFRCYRSNQRPHQYHHQWVLSQGMGSTGAGSTEIEAGSTGAEAGNTEVEVEAGSTEAEERTEENTAAKEEVNSIPGE